MGRYEDSLVQSSRLLLLLRRVRDDLEALYARRNTMKDEEMRRAKTLIFSGIKTRYDAMRREGSFDGTHSRWVSGNMNNARLVALATYHDLVPAFVQLFEDQDGDWEKFHRAVYAMKPLSKAQRRERLNAPRHTSTETVPELIHLDANRCRPLFWIYSRQVCRAHKPPLPSRHEIAAS